MVANKDDRARWREAMPAPDTSPSVPASDRGRRVDAGSSSCIPPARYCTVLAFPIANMPSRPPAPFGHPVANSSSGQVRCGLLKQDLASKDGHYLVCNLLNLLIRVRRGRNLWRYDCLRMRVPCATDGIASGNLISPGYSPIRLRDIVFLIRSKCSISSLREDIVVRQCRRSWKPPRSETKLSTYEAVDVKHLVTELQSKTSI